MNTSDLARRAVACPGWRWLPGMACVNASMPDTWCARIGDERKPTYNHYLPDLSDSCTRGGLLALVREARKDPTYLPTCLQGPPDEAWVVDRPSRIRKTWYESEAAALVAALEAAL